MDYPNHQFKHSRRGITLIEAVVSLTIVTVLMLGLSSAVMLGSFAMPSSGELGEADRKVHEIKSRIRDDMQIANSVTVSASGNTTRLTLTLIPTGATGQGSSILYEFIKDAGMIRRRIDSGFYEVLSTSLADYFVVFDTDGGKIRFAQFRLLFNDSIQDRFELFVRTPYRPELK